ncbi:MAG: hypothetical protein CM1200mP39_26870 [Dehalococcoidia bacterium]|nr:MAG: hypothetical protein CM1200mP39_26870 [Dehalococcoidia bacterium]
MRRWQLLRQTSNLNPTREPYTGLLIQSYGTGANYGLPLAYEQRADEAHGPR